MVPLYTNNNNKETHMSKRLTAEYTENSEGAFGQTGKIGDAGEIAAMEIIKRLTGFDVTHHPEKEAQMMGHDLRIHHPNGKVYGVDVKTNLFKGAVVCVDATYIAKSQAQFWFHLNKSDHSDYVQYRVDRMQRYVRNLEPTVLKDGSTVYWVPRATATKMK